MQDEKRQQSFFFSTIPHGIHFLSILIILWSIKACSKSRCILPQADSTCKHFLSRTPLSSPEAKHDYPILMRFLMWFFFFLNPCKTIQLSLMYIQWLMFAVSWYVKWTHVDVFASHASFSWFYRPKVCFLGFYVCMMLTFLWERKWGRCAVFATALHSNIWTHLVFMAELAVAESIIFLGFLSSVSFLWRWNLRNA